MAVCRSRTAGSIATAKRNELGISCVSCRAAPAGRLSPAPLASGGSSISKRSSPISPASTSRSARSCARDGRARSSSSDPSANGGRSRRPGERPRNGEMRARSCRRACAVRISSARASSTRTAPFAIRSTASSRRSSSRWSAMTSIRIRRTTRARRRGASSACRRFSRMDPSDLIRARIRSGHRACSASLRRMAGRSSSSRASRPAPRSASLPSGPIRSSSHLPPAICSRSRSSIASSIRNRRFCSRPMTMPISGRS
jgi:hypothetical protein